MFGILSFPRLRNLERLVVTPNLKAPLIEERNINIDVTHVFSKVSHWLAILKAFNHVSR